jgi:serine/threonine protein kinase
MAFPRSIDSRLDPGPLFGILRLLKRFEDHWDRGNPISLESLLREVDGAGQEELLRQALEVELDRRRHRGENPTPMEYLRRFPQHSALIQGVFDEPAAACSPESAGDSPGDLPTEPLGKFQLIGRLGTGGQGSALLARDLDLGRLVVLKRYHAPSGIGGDSRALWDGQAISRLRSRHVPQCYGVERIGSELILVMEYVPGRNIAEVARSDRLGFVAAARLIEQVAAGLEAVHACGLVHRDVKPENIVMGEDRVPRLVDFGLAAHFGSPALSGVAGTPPYMAPEQARGQWERIDGRTDIYGLGAVLYTLLTGRPPHPGHTPDESLEHARKGIVQAPRSVNRSVPRDLERVVLKALEPDSALRYTTVTEFRRALRRWHLSHRYRPLGLALGILLVVAAACLALIAFRLDRAKNQEFILSSSALHPLVKVDRGGQAFSLADAAPLESGDKLWIECDLPAGWHASAFWFDTEGRLTELSPLTITKGKSVDRLNYPPEDVVTVEGPPGTELIFICARPSSRIRHAEIAALLPIGRPLSVFDSPSVVWIDREHITLGNLAASQIRGPGAVGASPARGALESIQEVRQRLGSRIEYIAGVAFAHMEPARSTETIGAPDGALGGILPSKHKAAP